MASRCTGAGVRATLLCSIIQLGTTFSLRGQEGELDKLILALREPVESPEAQEKLRRLGRASVRPLIKVVEGADSESSHAGQLARSLAVLATLGPAGIEAAPIILDVVRNRGLDAGVRNSAAIAIVELCPFLDLDQKEAVRDELSPGGSLIAAIDKLHAGNSDERAGMILKTMDGFSFDPGQGVDELLATIDENRVGHREFAVELLAYNEGEVAAALPRLRSLLRKTPDPDGATVGNQMVRADGFREALALAITAIAPNHRDCVWSYAYLVTEHANAFVRKEAAARIRDFPDPPSEVEQALGLAVSDAERGVGYEAITTLSTFKSLGAHTRHILETVISAGNDDEAVQRAKAALRVRDC